MILILAFIFIVMPLWYVLHSWLGFEIITTISIIISTILLILFVIDVYSVIKAKKTIKEKKSFKAKLIDKKEIHGYMGKSIYTLEIYLENKKEIIEKENIHMKLKVNDIIDVYPIYDNQGELIDFDYSLDVQAKVSKFLIIINILSLAISTFLFFSDNVRQLEDVLNYIFSMLLLLVLLFVGIYFLKRYNGSKSNELIPVEGKVIGIRRTSRIRDGLTYEYLNPVYEVIVNGETYQFLGHRNIKKGQEKQYINSKFEVYYNSNTMNFYEKRNDKSDLYIAILLISFSLVGIIVGIKEVFNIF